MIHFMRGMLAACLCLCSSVLQAAGAQHAVELASSTAVLDEPLRAVLHLRPWDAAQLEYPVGCLQAELRYGDFVVPAAQVQVSAVPMPEVGYVRVAIFSQLVVSEPLVHLRLTLSCEPRLEQQWTLFSEPEGTSSVPRPVAPERVWKDSVAGMFAAAPAGPARSLPALVPAPARPLRAQRAALPQRPPAAPPAPAPQLRLDPADNAALAQAVRALWQQQGQAHYESLRTEVAALRLENEQLRARTQALLVRVEQWQPQRAAASPATRWQVSAAWVLHDLLPWVAALVLVAALAWFLRWLGSEGEGPWRGEAEPARTRLRQTLSRGSTAAARRPAAPALRPPAAAAPPARAAPVLATATVEHTLPDEVQAQADEFIQAGHLGAVAMLLETHLRTQAQKSAPVLLSLLDIYRDMGQVTQAERVGALLSQLFNLRDPAGGQDPGEGLEGHPATLHSITTQWNQPSVREVLKNLLLRPTAIEELSLSAFREVLALYEMAGLREASDPAFGLDWE
jgi:hypothetical protein